MAYYITGDCHAHFEKLIWLARFNKKLGKEDVIILLGDVGLNYFGADKDRENKKILADFPNYFLCVHGNHEERSYHIQTYRTQIWRGGEVYYEPEFQNIVFAKDGEIYDFDGKKAIVIGDAYSRDKEYRILTGLPWFPDEQPDDKVKRRATQYLSLIVEGDDQKIKSIADVIAGPNFAPKGKIAMKTQATPLRLD